LPEGHLAYFVSDLVDQLDLSAITRQQQILLGRTRGGLWFHGDSVRAEWRPTK
jgi:hypothetical protein